MIGSISKLRVNNVFVEFDEVQSKEE